MTEIEQNTASDSEAAGTVLAANLRQEDSGMTASSFRVKLDFFSGPLDLLLHLVRRQEVDISNVEMSKIADQYLQIIDEAKNLDLDVATEFLVVAATLVAMKSESVLPAHAEAEDGEGIEDLDPFGELRERLRKYELFKERAVELRQLPQLGHDTFARRTKEFRTPEPGKLKVDESAQDIGFHFVRMLKRIGETVRSFKIKVEPVSIVSCMMGIIDSLKASSANLVHGAGGSFLRLVSQANFKLPAGSSVEERSKLVRNQTVGHFIAMLELVKRGVLSVNQSQDMGDIQVALKMLEADEDVDLSTSEFDEPQPVEGNEKVVLINTEAAQRAWNVAQGAEDSSLETVAEEEGLRKEVNRD